MLSLSLTFSLALGASLYGAGITGFGNLSGWSVNILDTGSAPTLNTGTDTLNLLSGFQQRSVFFNTPQDVTKFTFSFTYQATGDFNTGTAIVFQNSPSGANALSGGAYGFTGITQSVAITLESTGGGPSANGVYLGGTYGGGSTSTSPVSLFSNRPIRITLSYDGTFLSRTYFDTVTSQSFSPPDAFVNIRTAIGGSSTAYVGFTGNTRNASPSNGGTQSFSQPVFATVPEPTSLALLASGVSVFTGRRSRRKVMPIANA